MNVKFRTFKRHITYLFQWIFEEKIRGLDFYMSDTSMTTASKRRFNGY